MPSHRRHLLRLGLGALASTMVRSTARATAPPRARPASAHACIVLYMHGGASQIDTFDPKPGRPTGGEFKAIPTALAGVRISEHLPGLAQRLDRINLIRSLRAREGNHQRARHLMRTGYPPQGGAHPPAFGAWVAEATDAGAVPGYVSIGVSGHGPGFLGATHAPFLVRHPDRPVRHLGPPEALAVERHDDRAELWRSLQGEFEQHHPSAHAIGHRQVVEQALAMMSSPAPEVFDLEREPASLRAQYGDSEFGHGCLMARRLVEAGVPFVEVGMRGWDTHDNNFERVRTLSGPLDTGLSALLDDLEARGRLDQTLVVWMGDFGRTPRINGRGGRDHYPACSSVLVAGGGTPRGQVIGATDDDGYEITERPITVADLMRTMATALGLDPNDTRMTPTGRPIAMVDGGQVIEELVPA